MRLNVPDILSKIIFFLIFLSANCHRIKEINSISDQFINKEPDIKSDHESFLGVEESKVFDKLLPEESKSRLKKLIISKVDKDGNEMVSEQELRDWILHISRISKEKERDKYFPIFSQSPESLLDFETYFNKIYGSLKVDQLDETSKDNLAIIKMQDDRKWKMADENKDNKLDRNEFLVFQHPEDYVRMKPLIIQETLEISDKDEDGFLDLKEYINDIWPPTSKTHPEPHMIKQEEETFANYRDKNRDNKLDPEEIGEWLMPIDYDPIEAETHHLMQVADIDEDGQLSLDEIINSYDTFVGSQATDYGNSLKHEEL